MQVLYKSTRGKGETVTASMAILKGLSEDGGLFVPTEIPKLDVPVEKLAQMTYQETAYEMMKNLTQKRLHRFMRQMENISWNFSTAQRLHSRIWHFLSFHI